MNNYLKTPTVELSQETKSKSTQWTDEKHSLYLKSMEASFVNQLYDSMDKLEPKSSSSRFSKMGLGQESIAATLGEKCRHRKNQGNLILFWPIHGFNITCPQPGIKPEFLLVSKDKLRYQNFSFQSGSQDSIGSNAGGHVSK